MSKVMKNFATAGVVAALTAGVSLAAHAETVIAVTQFSYDSTDLRVCTARRMNPAEFASLTADACALDTVGSYGPDRISKNTYDAAGQLTKVEEAVGTLNARNYVQYTYTNNGLKTTEKDSRNNLTTFEYDGVDRLRKIRYPSTTSGSATSSTTDYEQFSYNDNDSRTAWRRRGAQTVNYTYDNLKRVTVEDPPSTPNTYTGYDALGRVKYKRLSSASGVGDDYSYDSLGRLTSVTDMNSRTLTMGYDTASVRTSLTYPDSVAFDYSRDNLGRLKEVKIGSTAYFAQTYDNLGRRIKLIRNAGQNTVTSCQTNETCYAYDAFGRPTSMTNNVSGSSNDVTWTFSGYNPASQIMNWDASTTRYDYVESATSTDNRTFDGLNRDSTLAALTGGYDGNGNLTTEGTGGRTFTYDAYSRLLTVTGTNLSGVTVNVKLTYDALGRLASYSTDGGTTKSTFLYDGTDLIAVYDNSGALIERYVHSTSLDEPVVWFAGTATTGQYYLWQNYEGSVVAYASATGSVQERYQYGPYGEPQAGWSGSRFRYTGQTTLPEADLYYYKARVYDPMYGRFLQTDPLGTYSGMNLYEYTMGDPINFSDPLGLEKIEEIEIFCDKMCQRRIYCRTHGCADEIYGKPGSGTVVFRFSPPKFLTGGVKKTFVLVDTGYKSQCSGAEVMGESLDQAGDALLDGSAAGQITGTAAGGKNGLLAMVKPLAVAGAISKGFAGVYHTIDGHPEKAAKSGASAVAGAIMGGAKSGYARGGAATAMEAMEYAGGKGVDGVLDAVGPESNDCSVWGDMFN